MFERRQTIDYSQSRKGGGDDGEEDESALQFSTKVVDYGHGGGGSSSQSSKCKLIRRLTPLISI